MNNITDEDLNRKSNLITEKYNFELTGLKDPVDVRKPSRNFLKIENLFSKIFSRKIKTGPGLQGEGNLENDLTLSIKSNDPVINISQENGITLNKTDLTENDSNKLFSAKGALNLKNWLVTNYTSLMNNIKEALDTKIEAAKNSLISLINGKLNHGGYAGSGQDLKNLADSKVSKNGDTVTGGLKIQQSSYPSIMLEATNNPKESRVGYMELNPNGDINFITLGYDNTQNIVASLPPGKKGTIYHTGNKPTSRELRVFDSGATYYTGDLNACIYSGSYHIAAGCTNLPSGAQPDGQLIVFRGEISDTICQMYCEYTTSNIWVRSANGIRNEDPTHQAIWRVWQKTVFENENWKQPSKKIEDIGDFDLNHYYEEGFYQCHDGRMNVTNFPPQLANLQGMAFSLHVYKVNQYVIQDWISHTGKLRFTRFLNADGNWENWTSFTPVVGRAEVLWRGGHWMDGKAWLTIPNVDFNAFQSIVVYVCSENSDKGSAGGNRAGQLVLPTAEYGNPSYDWCDLIGDDWCGALLADNHSIAPVGNANTYIRGVWGIR